MVRGHTPEYASPGVIEGEVPASADDLFSLACVAYRMLAGKRAFGKLNALEAQAAGQRPERIEHLPPAQWQALDQALAFRRTDRPADVNAFIAALKGPRDESPALRDGVPALADRDPDGTPEATAEELALEVAREESGSRRAGLRWAAAAALAVAAMLVVATQLADRAPAGAGLAARLPAGTPAPEAAAVPLPARTPDEPSTAPEAASGPTTGFETEALDSLEPGRDGTVAAQVEPAADPGPLPAAIPGPDAEALAEPAPAAAAAPPPDIVVPSAMPAAPAPQAPAPAAAASFAIPQVAMAELRFRRYAEPRFFREGLPAVSGWVDIGFTVEVDGRTSGITILGGEPGGYWAETAAQAVRGWRFQPVARNGEVTAVRSEVRLRFAPDLSGPVTQQAAN